MTRLEVRQKYSAAHRIFNSLLGVSSDDETLRLTLDVLRHNQAFFSSKLARRLIFVNTIVFSLSN